MKKLLYIVLAIIALFFILTIWVEFFGEQKTEHIGEKDGETKALIVYNPDPIYNLDEQVCKAFAKGLMQQNIASHIQTNKNISVSESNYDLYVFCTNTYNFQPDKGIRNVIHKLENITNKPTVAITLGSGSTEKSKAKLEQLLNDKNVNLLGSRTYWLMRPNDDDRTDESNVKVALEMAEDFGNEIGRRLKELSLKQ